MTMKWKLLLAVGLSFLLVACSSNRSKTPTSTTATETETTEATPMMDDQSQNTQQSAVDAAALFTGANLVYYFDFDSSDLMSRTVDLLDRQIPVLLGAIAADSNYKVELSGHTDDRGSREYNNALGMRRAQSVSRYLRTKGVPAANIVTRSFGEDRPAAQGEGEEVWSLNRRVEVTLPAQ